MSYFVSSLSMTFKKKNCSPTEFLRLKVLTRKILLRFLMRQVQKSSETLNELTEEDIGFAEDLSTGKIELEKTVTIEGCKGGATFILRGTTQQTIDELETAIKNSFAVLKLMGDDSRVLPGAGCGRSPNCPGTQKLLFRVWQDANK